MKAAKTYVPYPRSARQSSTRTKYIAVSITRTRFARVSVKSSTALLGVVGDRRRAEFLGAGIDLVRAIKWYRHAPVSPSSSVLPVNQAIIKFIAQADLNPDLVIEIPDDLRGKIKDLRDELNWVGGAVHGFFPPYFWGGIIQMVIAGLILYALVEVIGGIREDDDEDDDGDDDNEGDDDGDAGDDGGGDSGDGSSDHDRWGLRPGEGGYERMPVSRDLLIQLVNCLERITR
jgi:hypothetical protein